MTEPRFGLPDPANPLARELEQVANQLPEIARPYDQLRALLHSLPAGRPPVIHSARAGTPVAKDPTAIGVGGTNSALTGPPPGFDSGAQIGILPQLFFGQSNAINDPEMADLINVTPVGVAENTLGSWFAKYVVNSGVVAVGRSVYVNYNHGDTFDNPFNSHDGEYKISAIDAAPSDVEYYLRSGTWSPANVPGQTGGLLVVGALRVTHIILNTVTNVTSCQVQLQLIDQTNAVIASGYAVEWTTIPYTGMRQLTVSTPHVPFRSYRLRLKIRVIATGTGGILNVDFGEPQLSFSTTERPPPYTPLIGGNWQPQYLRFTQNLASFDVIDIRRNSNGDVGPRLVVDGDGKIKVGSGAETTPSILLARGGAGKWVLSSNATANPTTLDIQSTAGQQTNLRLYVAGDTVPRTLIFGDATGVGFNLSSGAATADVQLLRVAAGAIRFTSNGQAASTNLLIQATAGQIAFIAMSIASDTLDRIVLRTDTSGFELGSGAATRDIKLFRGGGGDLELSANGQAFTTQFHLTATAGQRNNLEFYVAGDSGVRLHLEGSATEQAIKFGPGNAGTDLRVDRSAAKILRVDDSAGGAATLNVVGVFQINGTTVVGARKTGWTVATGTATRTTFATATVTLPILAEHVKALIDDLHNTAGHGLIGT